MAINLSIIGAGGHAKVVVDSVERSMGVTQIRFFEESASKQNERLLLDRYTVSTLEDWDNVSEQFHVAIGSNSVRSRISKHAISLGKKPVSVLHHLAAISKNALLEKGVFIAANSIIAPSVVIKVGCIINHAAIVDHDCSIGEYSHIAPSATLGGGVIVGRQCLVGAGAIVLPGVQIGDYAVIGAGSVVTRDVPAHEKFVGVPAKRVK